MLDRTAFRYAVIGLAAAVGLFLIGVSVIAALGHAVPKELWAFGTAIGGGLLGVLVPRPEASAGPKSVAESSTVHSAASAAASQAVEALAAEPPPAPAAANETPAEALARIRQKAEEAAGEVSSPENLKVAIAASSASPGAGAAGGTLAAQHYAKASTLDGKAEGADPAAAQELTAQARVYRAAAAAAQQPATLKAAEAAAEAAPPGSAKLGDYVAKLGPPVLVFLVALALGTALTAGWIVPPHEYQSAAIKEGNELLALATAAGGAIVGVLSPSPGQKKPATT